MNVELDRTENHERAARVGAALKNVAPLSYQQNQLVQLGEFRPVLNQLRAKQWMTNTILSAIAVLLGCRVVDGLLKQQWHVWSLTLGATLVWWISIRVRRIRSAGVAVDEYARHLPQEQPSATSRLAAELRLNQPLDYAQLQKVKSGDVLGAAAGVARSRRRNGRVFLRASAIGSAFILVAGLVDQAFESTESSTSRNERRARYLMLVVWNLATGACAYREFRAATQLERLTDALRNTSEDAAEPPSTLVEDEVD